MSLKISHICFTLVLLFTSILGLQGCTADQRGNSEVAGPRAIDNSGPTDTPKPANTERPTETPEPASTRRPSETPEPTYTSGPTNTPEPTSLVFSFEEILTGILRPYSLLPCQMSAQKAVERGLPAIIYESNELLCIFGFPMGDQVSINIFDPYGSLSDSLRLPVERQFPITYVYIPFAYMLDLPAGEWRITAETNFMYVEAFIQFGMDEKPILSRYPLLSPPAVSPLDPRRTDDFLVSDTIIIQGSNLPPNIDLPVGIYRHTIEGINNRYIPLFGEISHTTHEGRLRTQYSLHGLSDTGIYTVFLFLNTEQPNSAYGQLQDDFSFRSPLVERWIKRDSQMALGNNMLSNEVMYPGHLTMSENGKYAFIYQTDGNLVLYRTEDWMPLWASNTMGSQPGVCIMQTDGNLVIYDQDGAPIWSTDTWHDPGSYLIVQNDGNVVIYRPDNTPLWATNTVQP